ncbi:MAG TPA: MMPL family transporter, partial [Thermoleophilaceae bacterium]|nr:MMPL family transporter [Thermoleophilaceae bacterium]
PLVRGLPDDSSVKQSYSAASAGFAPGILAPTVVVVEDEGIARRSQDLRELQRLISRQPGVAEVVGPADQPLERSEFGAVLSPTGDAARYVVILNADPLGGRAIAFLRSLQRRSPELLERAGLGGATIGFAGDTALVTETVEKTFDDLAAIAPVLALVVLLILAVFLRALVAPLYLLLASVLALCASLGLTIYVFQDLLGHGEITYYVPFAAAVLLVALGSDYNVFLVGRIWHDARERPIREAIVTGGSSAARPITAAGLILAGSFALLALVPTRSFHELAFAMAVGLLIDAFVVRTLLVPALMALAGRFSAWPSRRLFRAEPAAGPARPR